MYCAAGSEFAKSKEMKKRDAVPGLGANLRAARVLAGLNQKQAGEKSGVHAVNISRFESDKATPSLKTLFALARAYQVKPASLLPILDQLPKRRRHGRLATD